MASPTPVPGKKKKKRITGTIVFKDYIDVQIPEGATVPDSVNYYGQLYHNPILVGTYNNPVSGDLNLSKSNINRVSGDLNLSKSNIYRYTIVKPSPNPNSPGWYKTSS